MSYIYNKIAIQVMIDEVEKMVEQQTGERPDLATRIKEMIANYKEEITNPKDEEPK